MKTGTWIRRYATEKVLPPRNFSDDVAFENAWIVFLTNESWKIIDLQVYEADRSDVKKFANTIKSIDNKLKDFLYFDFGNSLNDWKEWTFQDVLFKLSIQYQFIDYDTAVDSIKRLMAIDKFKPAINGYLKVIRA